MTERIECAVIGAGVAGLAIARRLAAAGREVVVVEADSAFGTHTSSRNSEVIHYPGLKDGTLQPGYTGIRPKIHGPGQPAPDFRIHGTREHGVGGLVNLFGIESPGPTSSLAIADHVADLLAM